MARKAKKVVVEVVLSEAEKIEKARADMFIHRWISPDVIAPPTRSFTIGEHCYLGGLSDCTVAGIYLDGKQIVVKHSQGYLSDWWHEVDKQRRKDIPRLFEEARRGSALTSGMDSIIHLYMADGLVCDPTYQRGYVWTTADKEALLDSVFERLEIGSFTFVRKHGFSHEGDDSVMHYVTLAGDDFYIPKSKDYCVTIIDGQQRLTTLIDFYLDRFAYKGILFSEMNQRDRNEFCTFSVQFRMIEEEQVTRLDILKLFLQANRGVPQSPEHVAKVKALYDAEKANGLQK